MLYLYALKLVETQRSLFYKLKLVETQRSLFL
jgi:hypothetical protein